MDDRSSLLHKKCVPCEAGTPAFTKEQVEKYKKKLITEWDIIDDKKLKKVFKFKDFVEAMKFVNKVADIAESEGHHPDIYIFYNKVTIELWTHAIGGLSENDFIVARKIEEI